jgi:hypothetical protein
MSACSQEHIEPEFENDMWPLESEGLKTANDNTSKTGSKSDEGDLFYIIQNDKYGYIDKDGNVIIQPLFDQAFDFSEGYARVVIGKKYGFIDKNGTIAIKPEYEYASDLHEERSGW